MLNLNQAMHLAQPGALPLPHHGGIPNKDEWIHTPGERRDRTHSFPPRKYSDNHTTREDVETEPIHFTQDVHRSIPREIQPMMPPLVPGLQFPKTGEDNPKKVDSLGHLFSDPSPNGAQLGSPAGDPHCGQTVH